MNNQTSIIDSIARKFSRDTSRYPLHLLENLAGTVKIELRDSGEFCCIEPATGKSLENLDKPDLLIRMHSGDARRLLAGDLNPQIAMLSGKIQIEGRANLAMYLFNVLGSGEHET